MMKLYIYICLCMNENGICKFVVLIQSLPPYYQYSLNPSERFLNHLSVYPGLSRVSSCLQCVPQLQLLPLY